MSKDRTIPNINGPVSARMLAAYQQGRLSAQEAHALEMAALDDPLLAEALEGLEAVEPAAWQADMAVLDERMKALLNEEEDDKVIVVWWRRPMSIAAAVVLLMAAGLVFWSWPTASSHQDLAMAEQPSEAHDEALMESTNQAFEDLDEQPLSKAEPTSPTGTSAGGGAAPEVGGPDLNTSLALQEEPTPAEEPTPTSQYLAEASAEPEPVDAEVAVMAPPSRALEDVTIATEDLVLAEVAELAVDDDELVFDTLDSYIVGYASGGSAGGEVAAPTPAPTAESEPAMVASAPALRATGTPTRSQSSGVEQAEMAFDEEITTPQPEPRYAEAMPIPQEAPGRNAAAPRNRDALEEPALRTLTGVVTDAEGQALPGVNVMVTDLNRGTITNIDGTFSVEVPFSAHSLTLSYIGFERTEVPLSLADTTMDVVLKESAVNLAEVEIVSDYSYRVDQAIILAQAFGAVPIGGFVGYYDYLISSVDVPESITRLGYLGSLKLRFTIDEDGVPKDFTILRYVGYGIENQIINLIKSGPLWNPAIRNTWPTATTIELEIPIYN